MNAAFSARNPRREVRSFAERAAQWVYPRRCSLCDTILADGEEQICPACRKDLRMIAGPVCFRCGRPLTREEEEYCAPCRNSRHLFSAGFAPFVYDGAVKEAIIRFKYGHRAEYAAFFAEAIRRYGSSFLRDWEPQALVPVPVHRSRLIRRGYNQAELLARALSHQTGIPVLGGAVCRVRGTAPQKELGVRERQQNLRGAFVRGRRMTELPARILIVDDIFTTGSTVDAVSAQLLRAGAREIRFACAAIAPGF